MRVVVKANDLFPALQAVKKITPLRDRPGKRGTVDELRSVIISAEPGIGLLLCCTDLDKALTTRVPADVWEHGICAVPARLFADFVGTLLGATLRLDCDHYLTKGGGGPSDVRLRILAGRTVSNLCVEDITHLPDLPTIVKRAVAVEWKPNKVKRTDMEETPTYCDKPLATPTPTTPSNTGGNTAMSTTRKPTIATRSTPSGKPTWFKVGSRWWTEYENVPQAELEQLEARLSVEYSEIRSRYQAIAQILEHKFSAKPNRRAAASGAQAPRRAGGGTKRSGIGTLAGPFDCPSCKNENLRTDSNGRFYCWICGYTTPVPEATAVAPIEVTPAPAPAPAKATPPAKASKAKTKAAKQDNRIGGFEPVRV